MGVQQYPMEPLVHGEPDPEVGKYPSSGALEPMSPEKIAGVPREVQLTIRNDEGASGCLDRSGSERYGIDRRTSRR